MKLRLFLAGVVAAAMALALFGVLNGVDRSQALIPQPIQPFQPADVGGLSSTQLGAAIINHSDSEIIKGERAGLPWNFVSPGFDLMVDKQIADGTPIGVVQADVDALCDGAVDVLASSCSPLTPYLWVERTTAVEGTSEAYVKAIMPPFSFLLRERADATTICLGGAGGIGLPVDEVLNTVYTNVPWSPNSASFAATSKLGGRPAFPNPGGAVCLDSPQSSFSEDNKVWPVAVGPPEAGAQCANTADDDADTVVNDGCPAVYFYKAPAPESDSDGPCNPALNFCADAAVVGFWTQSTVAASSLGAPVVVPVTKEKVNNGPTPGNFMEHWETEVTTANIAAVWTASGTSVLDLPVSLPPGPQLREVQNLQVSCTGPGEGLVVLKNILWPINALIGPLPGPPTKDTYADDNAATFVVRVVCNGVEGSPLVDKEVIWLKPVAVAPTIIPSTPKHLQMMSGELTIVTVDELKANHHTSMVTGQEWLVAEVSDVDGVPGPDVAVQWGGPLVTTDPPVPVTVPVDCTTGPLNTCMTYQVEEPHGQVDVIANLQVMCPPTTLPGLYSIVLKGIDAPLPPYGEAKPSDNASRSVIKVWCGVPNPDAGIPDTIDDASGLYPRWTIVQSDADDRRSLKSPPSIASDTGYVERTIDLQCFWMDANGAPDLNGDGVISAQESRLDPDMPGGIDDDGDCLADSALAQPSHPVDLVDTPTGTLCPVLPYSEAPSLVQYDTAADMDCDGLVDGIERAWGSNPLVADSDGDGATDFIEMFQYTNPLNPDTDGDGIYDKPDDDYIGAAAGAAESGEGVNADDNCPAVYNPDQANNDGKRRDNGSVVPGSWASNPMGDKMGDACDTDDDNDGADDVAELAREDPVGTPDPTNPLIADSDGDRCLDGVEGYLGKDPTSATSKCPASLTANPLKFFRACRWNEPNNGYDGGLWDAEYDGMEDNVEWDPDGDGLVCQTGTTIADTDNDDGTGTGALAPVEIVDNVEIMGYGTIAANKDSDGDGCQDWIEIVDVNGNRSAELLDVLFVAKRALGVDPNPGSDVVLDVDKNGSVTILDALVAAKNSSLVKSHSPCASEG
jgi:hypothetical protein